MNSKLQKTLNCKKSKNNLIHIKFNFQISIKETIVLEI